MSYHITHASTVSSTRKTRLSLQNVRQDLQSEKLKARVKNIDWSNGKLASLRIDPVLSRGKKFFKYNLVQCLIMFGVSVALLILLLMGKYINPEHTRSLDYDSAWEELFGHLSGDSIAAISRGPNLAERDKMTYSALQPKPTELPKMMLPPAPPAPPFVFSTENGKLPSIATNTYGNMEGIAISQNRGIALGIYMVNSSYNSFNTVFGNSNMTKLHRLPDPKLAKV